MKHLLYVLIVFLFASCATSTVRWHVRNERYIKSAIQQRGESVDRITLYKLKDGGYQPGETDIDIYELTGYTYNGAKGVVLGIGIRHVTGISHNIILYKYETEHVELTAGEAGKIVSSWKALLDEAKQAKPDPNAEIYSDQKINDKVFISFSKKGVVTQNMAIWVNNKKMFVPTTEFVEAIEKFLR